MRAEVDGERLSDEEIFSFLRLLLPAGVETTYRASGSLLYALLTNPAQLERCYGDRSLIPQAFEEVDALGAPGDRHPAPRHRGHRDRPASPIEAGADVALLIGAANRDERKYERPDRYDIFRARQHVGFGFGVHVCLGMHLARMESRVASTPCSTAWARCARPRARPGRTSRASPSAPPLPPGGFTAR